jgi:hypothetical protein
MSVNVSASSVGKPSRISSELVIATGVPKPEMPSNSAPNEKPTTTSTTRRSFGMLSSSHMRNAAKRPERCAML